MKQNDRQSDDADDRYRNALRRLSREALERDLRRCNSEPLQLRMIATELKRRKTSHE